MGLRADQQPVDSQRTCSVSFFSVARRLTARRKHCNIASKVKLAISSPAHSSTLLPSCNPTTTRSRANAMVQELQTGGSVERRGTRTLRRLRLMLDQCPSFHACPACRASCMTPTRGPATCLLYVVAEKKRTKRGETKGDTAWVRQDGQPARNRRRARGKSASLASGTTVSRKSLSCIDSLG